MFESLGERMKFYEENNSSRILLNTLPTIVRLDGRAFHTFTQYLEKPFDEPLIQTMISCVVELVDETNAVIGYTQSDEISLILFAENYKSEIYFGGKRDKINSVLSSIVTHSFEKYKKLYGLKVTKPAYFDCRCFNVPSKTEACNYLIWREQDAVRNSIHALAQSKFSHRQLQGKCKEELQEMLFKEFGINWNDLPVHKKRGWYSQNRPKSLPILSTISNIEDVIFSKAEPILKV